jgi:hypothetical protein
MKDWKNWIVLICIVIGLAMIGCESVIDSITPCVVPRLAARYVDEEPATLFGIVQLSKAKEIREDMKVKHRDEQERALRAMKDDTYYYQVASGLFDIAIAQSQSVQDVLIGDESNPFSVAGLLSIGGLSFLAGSLRKRKGDLDPKEVEVIKLSAKAEGVAEANGKKT